MVCLFLVNQVFSLMLLVPLWYTAYQIHTRHHFLSKFIGTKDRENESFSKINSFNLWITVTTFLCFILEIVLYFVYNRLVIFRNYTQ